MDHNNELAINPINSFIIALACLAILLMGSIGRDLWTPDEPRDAAISLEMSRTGEYLIPHLAGMPFIEKPPLYFAVAAGSINTVGKYIGDLNAIRLTTVLFGIGTLLMTFLLAGRLYGKEGDSGILAAAILATMVGFVENFHWIRVDSLLCFFVIAAVWSFAEAYFAQKAWFCIPAGLFSAGAFLSKGPIGPALIAIPWFTLFVLWLVRPNGKANMKKGGFIGFHVAGLLFFIVLSGSWVLYLKLKGGADLWNNWFWVNQVGRLTGTSAGLGHIRTGKPFYYLLQTASYTSPWFPLILVWLGAVIGNLFKRRTLSHSDIFLFVWGAGALLLLSLSATKRSIYLAPLIPAFALMCIPALKAIVENKWIRGYGYFWVGLCVFLLAVFALVPFAASYLPHSIPSPALAFLHAFGLQNLVSGAACGICLYILFNFRKRERAVGGMIFATFLLYVGLFAVPAKAIDTVKSMRFDIRNFTDRIPVTMRPHIAGYNFNETMLGCFYYYAGWAVPQITDKDRVNRIVAETDPQYDSIIINVDAPRSEATQFINDLETAPYRIIDEQYTGNKHLRGVFWIKGADQHPQSSRRK